MRERGDLEGFDRLNSRSGTSVQAMSDRWLGGCAIEAIVAIW